MARKVRPVDENELDRKRAEHNQRLLKAHLAKLHASPERFFQTTTASEEASPEGTFDPDFEAEWQEFKRRHAGKVIQQRHRPSNPLSDFALLGVPPQATRVEIRRAFILKAKSAHPDHGGHADAFRALMEAYHRLTDGKG